MPVGQNNPQKCSYGLYAEQLSGSSFTQARHTNFRSWLYRIQPSVAHQPYKPVSDDRFQKVSNEFSDKSHFEVNPNQLRWKPIPFPSESEKRTFIEGLLIVGGHGDPQAKNGLAIYQYSCNSSMDHQAMYNSDGDFLIVPQLGTLYITTEFGKLTVSPTSICVIPRGIRFAVDVNENSRGWICEIYESHYRLPDLGPIGANGLANERDFEAPTAYYEDKQGEEFTIYNKFMGKFFYITQDHSPFDVVGWHGNYYPYRYDLNKFCPMNAVSFDHPDPSIFTVLTAPSAEIG